MTTGSSRHILKSLKILATCWKCLAAAWLLGYPLFPSASISSSGWYSNSEEGKASSCISTVTWLLMVVTWLCPWDSHIQLWAHTCLLQQQNSHISSSLGLDLWVGPGNMAYYSELLSLHVSHILAPSHSTLINTLCTWHSVLMVVTWLTVDGDPMPIVIACLWLLITWLRLLMYSYDLISGVGQAPCVHDKINIP